MKKNLIISSIIFLGGLISCQKNNSDSISLTATTTSATVGQAVGFTVSTAASAVNWTVTPSISANKLYTITNQKSNVITFSRSGQYIVGVSARDLAIDTSIIKNVDSCWHSRDHDHGHCTKGLDSATVTITVK